ncbi:hypothetical protein AB0G04_32445 [Actinoplanes sp. NPDC023801]|uniref:hypothetical protein n=1 Tax=Actinoplanes sp. NPDC023801 TaxID=3154595 RepID=UPI0033CBEE6F
MPVTARLTKDHPRVRVRIHEHEHEHEPAEALACCSGFYPAHQGSNSGTPARRIAGVPFGDEPAVEGPAPLL